MKMKLNTTKSMPRPFRKIDMTQTLERVLTAPMKDRQAALLAAEAALDGNRDTLLVTPAEASQAQRRAAIVALQADAQAASMPTAQDEILTLKQVAERIHRHASFVDRIVRRGRCAPRRELAVRWPQSLNLAPEIAPPELFDGEE